MAHKRKRDIMSEKNLELYVKTTCPYCHKVLSFMEENGIELPLRNIETSDADRDRLIEVGGKRQVPCLFIDGKPLYESSDIIDFLGQEFGVSAKGGEAPEMPSGSSCTIGGGCSF